MSQYTHGHRQRLRDRLCKNASDLAEYEVLELLLGYVLTRQDTKPLAKELLARFGSIRGVLDAREQELTTVPGFGLALSAYWLLLRETMARYAEGSARKRTCLCSPQIVAHMARTRLAGSSHEEFWVAYLDARNHLLVWERAFKGSVASAPFYPREVIARALELKASALILVHNHPGSSAEPSAPDTVLTRDLTELGTGMGIHVQDHVIVTDQACYSLMLDGMITPDPAG